MPDSHAVLGVQRDLKMWVMPSETHSIVETKSQMQRRRKAHELGSLSTGVGQRIRWAKLCTLTKQCGWAWARVSTTAMKQQEEATKSAAFVPLDRLCKV